MIDILKNSYKLILFIIFFIICFLIYLLYNTKYPTTNDANVYADVIPVGATNNGLLNDVFVKNHMAVKKGDLLFTIVNPNDVFDLNYKENILVKNLSQSNNSTLRTFFSTNNIISLKEDIYRLKQDPNSDHKLLKEKLFQLNQMRKNLVMIFYNLLVVGETLEHAELIQTNLTAIESEITLINNMVFSEIDGYISEFSLKKGALVKSYEPILGIIDDQHRYIIANYLEQDLRHIKIGDKAEIKIPLHPKKTYEGIVESIAQGIDVNANTNSSKTLPYVQQTINWIRLARRFPVKIKITNYNKDEDHLLVGANATVKIISE